MHGWDPQIRVSQRKRTLRRINASFTIVNVNLLAMRIGLLVSRYCLEIRVLGGRGTAFAFLVRCVEL